MEGLWWLGEKSELSLRKDLPVPSLKNSNDVKIKVAYAGICGSDIHFMKKEMGALGAKDDGLILGHEFTGTVVEAGRDSQLKVGDAVCVNPNTCCGECTWNSERLPQFCEKNLSIGCLSNGGWAQYFVMNDKWVRKLPDNVDLRQGALGEPLSCVLRAWKRLEPLPDTHARILVQGAGIIGILFCQLLHHHGYKNVTVSEPHEARRKLIMGLGFGVDAVQPQEIDLMFSGKDIDSQGFHVIFDSTGSTVAVQKAFEIARRGAKICIMGCCPAGKTITLEPIQFVNKELTIVGAFINAYCFDDTMDLLGELSKNGNLQCDKLGVKVFKLEEYEEALENLKMGKASKAMFKID